MPQIRIYFLIAVASAVFSLSGCGDANPKAVFSPESNGHAAGWSTSHKTNAKANLETCVNCHGENLDGGVSKVACTSCHLESSKGVHPEMWGSYAYARHSAYVNAQKTPSDPDGTTKCANIACHGATLSGVAGSGPACLSCHMGSNTKIHPLTWIPLFTTAPGIAPTNLPDHGIYVNSGSAAACVNAACHGAGGSGVFLSGRACRACHV